MKYLVLLLVLFSGLCGCSGVKIIPQQEGVRSTGDRAAPLVRQQGGVSVIVSLGDVSVRPALPQQNYCSFRVEINNQRTDPLPVSFADITLVDSAGQRYDARNPVELTALLLPNIPLLLPYPYIGYYYLGDRKRDHAWDQFHSDAAYSTSRRPEYIQLEALPEGPLLPGTSVAGMVYFAAELRSMQSFEIIYRSAGSLVPQNASLRFPFSVEKN